MARSAVAESVSSQMVTPSSAVSDTPDSRTEILNSAAQCFMDNGFSATSIDDVARSLSATKGMIYHHFRSKTDLFFEVYRRAMRINVEAIEAVAQSNDNANTALTRMAMAHAVVMMYEQAFQRVLAQGVALHQQGATTAAQRETLQELIAIRNDYETRFRLAIEQAASEESVTVEDTSIAPKSFLAVLNSTVYWYSPRSQDADKERSRIARLLVETAMRGIGLQPDPTALKELGANK